MRILFIVSVMNIITLASSCADGSLTGATGSKQAKRTTTADTESDEASKPEVVTGAYLACNQVSSSDPKEHSFGCNVKDKETNELVDITNVKTTLLDSKNKPVAHELKVKDLSLLHDHQAQIFFPVAAGKNLKLTLSASVKNKPVDYGQDFSQEISILNETFTALAGEVDLTKSLSDLPKSINATNPNCDLVRKNPGKSPARAFKNSKEGGCFTEDEVRKWCNDRAKKRIRNFIDPDLAASGTACGIDFVKSNKTLIDIISPGGKSLAVKMTELVGDDLSNTGACERVGATSVCAPGAFDKLFLGP